MQVLIAPCTASPSLATATVDLAAWPALVRAQRLIPAVALAADAIAAPELAGLDAVGPLVIVVGPPGVNGATGAEAWRRLRRLLAATRAPLLRFSTIDAPPCQVAPFLPDVTLHLDLPHDGPSALREATASGSWGISPAADPRCMPCSLAATCPGPRGPLDAVEPVPVAVSNQFDLVESGTPVAATATGCPVPHTGVVQEGPRVFLLQNGQLRAFVAPAQSWATAAVDAALARGQLYLDASDKPRLDDFAADLRLLVHQHPAHGLPTGATCPGAWAPAAAQPFEAEEALLRQHLGALRGVVVDVGAGPVRYLAELRAAADAGHLTYVAVEPERAALLRTGAALPAAGLVQATGERLPLADACADAVLFLRSFNHLHDVGAALAEAARVLKPGGTLLLCDNVAFGLLRTPGQLARAHAVPVADTPFEHFRNADADMAAAWLEPGLFVEVERHEVGPGRSNQWLLLARRTVTAPDPAPARVHQRGLVEAGVEARPGPG